LPLKGLLLSWEELNLPPHAGGVQEGCMIVDRSRSYLPNPVLIRGQLLLVSEEGTGGQIEMRDDTSTTQRSDCVKINALIYRKCSPLSNANPITKQDRQSCAQLITDPPKAPSMMPYKN
jgi:hypothetical protein